MDKPRSTYSILRIALIGIAAFAILAAIFLTLTLWSESSAAQAKQDALVTSQTNLVNTERSVITNKLNRLSDDLIYIRSTLDLDGYASGDYDAIAADWIAFANSQQVYDQIRFIDTDGNEVIRVNYDGSTATVVPADQLQNKADRYYFYESIGIGTNSIYVSKLDLNVEGDTVEQPIKPMIRLCMPYYDNTGTLRGIICLNYLADDVLSSVAKIAVATEGATSLLNEDGYWFYDQTDDSLAWGFMYPDRTDETFANAYPAEWDTIRSESEGHVLTSNGLFTFTNALASEEYTSSNMEYGYVFDESGWVILSRIAPTGDYARALSVGSPRYLLLTIRSNILVLILLLGGALTFSVLFERNRFRKQRVKYFSEYDEMTGTLNRREGLARLANVAQRRRSDDTVGCVCFIDVNDLKTVNDTFGHEAGDELILTVLKVIKESIREGDSVIRMGGDEFIIAFDNLDATGAEQVWERIATRYDEINASGEYRYPITASHGIAEFVADATLDDVIEQADTRMYEEKRALKTARAAAGV